MVHEVVSFKRLLHLLASVSAKIPIVCVGFCKADLIESYYSNNSQGCVVLRRKAGIVSRRDLLNKYTSNIGLQRKAAYILSKDGRRFMTVQEALALTDSQSINIQSIHLFEETRHDSEHTIKVRQLRESTIFELKAFSSEKVLPIKDKRLKHKIMLIGSQLSEAIANATKQQVCELEWEAVIDEQNKVKVLCITLAKLSGKCQTNCVYNEEVKATEADDNYPALKPETPGPERRRLTRGKMTDLGYKFFLEILAKQFEQRDCAKAATERLSIIKARHLAEFDPDQPTIDDRLQRVISNVQNKIVRSPTIKSMKSKDEIIEAVHNMLTPKVVSSPRKSARIMKPVSYNKRKSLMPTQLQYSRNSLANSSAKAVNKYRRERLKNLELPHYALKHSLSPSSPSQRLVSLLLTEEEQRLKKKGYDWNQFGLTSTSTPGSPAGIRSYLSMKTVRSD